MAPMEIDAIALPLVFATVGTAVLVAWYLSTRVRIRRGRLLLEALSDSLGAPGAARDLAQVVVESGPHASGFAATIWPAPAPFRRLDFRFFTANPLRWRQRERLVVYAQLAQKPSAELAWTKGATLPLALGVEPGSELWTLHRLDFTGAEFATRGVDTGTIEYAFRALQTRYGPALQHFSICSDSEPMFELALATSRLRPHELPALLALLTTAARAAVQV